MHFLWESIYFCLEIHIKSVHELIEIEFPCNHCENQFTQESSLKAHIISVHEHIKLPCKYCKKQFGTKRGMKAHIRSVHEEIKFPY